jgi:hypothetical protein
MIALSTRQGAFMSAKGESYKSKSAKMKHEKGEGKMERKMEYGKKAPVRKKKMK